jgi:hypothetical protein
MRIFVSGLPLAKPAHLQMDARAFFALAASNMATCG